MSERSVSAGVLEHHRGMQRDCRFLVGEIPTLSQGDFPALTKKNADQQLDGIVARTWWSTAM